MSRQHAMLPLLPAVCALCVPGVKLYVLRSRMPHVRAPLWRMLRLPSCRHILGKFAGKISVGLRLGHEMPDVRWHPIVCGPCWVWQLHQVMSRVPCTCGSRRCRGCECDGVLLCLFERVCAYVSVCT